MKKIYLIRHTAPEVERNICYGQTDLALKPTFEQEAEAIKQVIPNHEQIPFWTSPLQRCYLLAQKLNPNQITIDERLKEINFGDWEMKPWNEIPERELMPWMGNFVNMRTPNGESYLDLNERALNCWNEIIKLPHETIGIVTHYGIIQSLLANLLHIPFEKAFRLQLDYGNVFLVTLNRELVRVKFLK
ncbi:MAG: alpha-ribazole phosphatase [Microscillaceae bacterium]|nr:alpha-ribazole phosphatase [Microscillaceae bacterium]MDW8461784.1 alpha-ribazole phosphatase [Cytophagales bacterium]